MRAKHPMKVALIAEAERECRLRDGMTVAKQMARKIDLRVLAPREGREPGRLLHRPNESVAVHADEFGEVVDPWVLFVAEQSCQRWIEAACIMLILFAAATLRRGARKRSQYPLHSFEELTLCGARKYRVHCRERGLKRERLSNHTDTVRK